MTTDERRLADRIEVAFPARIYARGRSLQTEVRDLSRTGVRLRVLAHALGVKPSSDLPTLAERVEHALTPSFALDLHSERLGALVQRCVALVRIGLAAEEPAAVELCCEFDHPLSDEEETFLQTHLPEVREEPVAAWVPAESMPAQPCTGMATIEPARRIAPADPKSDEPASPPELRPRQRYRALVAGTARNAPPSFFCHTDLITAVGVRVAVPRADYGPGVAQALTQLTTRYGALMELRLVADGEDVWKGPARVSGVELPGGSVGDMLVTLAFCRPLALHELRVLGLVSRVA